MDSGTLAVLNLRILATALVSLAAVASPALV
jgi:hypothetical protein